MNDTNPTEHAGTNPTATDSACGCLTSRTTHARAERTDAAPEHTEAARPPREPAADLERQALRYRAAWRSARCRAAQLDTELAGRSEEARERWITQQLDQTALKAADFRNGVAMEVEPAREAVAYWVAAARAMLDDAPNYAETTIEMEVKVAEAPERYAFVLQRVAPDALTPHQARQQVERQREEIMNIVSDWCVEANDVGGIDAGDLAWRLEQAGYPLPTPPDEHNEPRPGADSARE